MAKYTLNKKDNGKELSGTNQADRATITKGELIYFYGNGGDDTITVKSGENNRAYGGDGKDTIEIKGGSQNVVYGYGYDGTGSKDGSNTLKISGGKSNVLYGGPKKDYLSITGKGSVQQIHGGGGNDEITVDATSTSNYVYGEAGNDKIEIIKSGKDLYISGGAGQDTITVRGTASWNIFGSTSSNETGDKKDIIKVYSGKGYISGGAGNDEILLGKGVKNVISAYGNDGNDKITVSYGSNHKITGGKGQDTININKGTGHTINADSNDVISLKKGTGASVINIENGNSAKQKGKVTLNSGSKAKLILDNNSNKYASKLTISAAKGTVTDKTLYFTGQYQTADTVNYTFKQSGSTLVINNSIYIENFANGNYDNGFVFSSGSYYSSSMTFEEIKKEAKWK